MLHRRKTFASGAWCFWGFCQIAGTEASLFPGPWQYPPRQEENGCWEERVVLAHFDNWCYNKNFGLLPGEDTALHLGTRVCFKRSCSSGPSWDLLQELFRQACNSPRDLYSTITKIISSSTLLHDTLSFKGATCDGRYPLQATSPTLLGLLK